MPAYPGRIIKRGEQDQLIVAAVKERLNVVLPNEVSLNPSNPLFGPTTKSAVRLFQSRNADAAGRPLNQDGEIGGLTWDVLFGQRPVKIEGPTDGFLMRVLSHAMGALGVREQPRNSNRGPQVDEYLKRTGVPPGLPWCAAFVYWCFDEAAQESGLENPCVKTAGCLDHWNRARQAGAHIVHAKEAIQKPSLIVPGMIFIMSHGGGLGHTGLIEKVEGALFYTIEGNTDASRTREGGGVYRLVRKVAEINTGYIYYAS